MITKIESLLDRELAKVQGNEDVCSDIFGSQKSKILEDRISSAIPDPTQKGWMKAPGGWEGRKQWVRTLGS
ncbi:hypothetical protein FACS1894126_1530 [Alphaproteobacteria bacterium]|nr:hypothetical protein FACS1894126_1530 [Alphaproteobacteria bacterium]